MNERDIDDVFGKFGRIASIWIARKPPGFAFVTYEDERDAEDSVREIDGREVYKFCGYYFCLFRVPHC